LELLSNCAPEYGIWVGDVLRGIVICRCNSSRTRSSSWMHAPGIILASTTINPVTIAEMLVHESSHQYFHLVSRVGKVDTGEDHEEYFSPAVQRPRPISRILIGYHAFANVLLFYRALLRNGMSDDSYCRTMENRLCYDVEALELPLRGNSSLTDIGRGLAEPLMEQVHQSPLYH
jgi:HEXXH motif-containing protein